MPENEMSPEEAVRAVYSYAAQMMKNGSSEYAIRRDLVEKGLSEAQAQAVVGNLSRIRADALRKAATRNMLIGGVVFVIGLLITILTYSAAASSPRGGSYIVAWGAVIFGAIQFFRGLSRYNKL